MNTIWLAILIFNFTINDGYCVKKKRYEGFVFSKNHFLLMTVGDDFSRYTPSLEDITKSENILSRGICRMNIQHINQSNDCPVIDKKMRKYKRQYFGFINSKGDKVLWINFIWSKYVSKDGLTDDVILVNDGCSYYWNVKVDLSNDSLYDLHINGRG
jgi:hypothetical protein